MFLLNKERFPEHGLEVLQIFSDKMSMINFVLRRLMLVFGTILRRQSRAPPTMPGAGPVMKTHGTI